MKYQDPYWNCPNCVQMQNLPGQGQRGEMPREMQPDMEPPYMGMPSYMTQPMRGGWQQQPMNVPSPQVPPCVQRWNMPQDRQPMPYYQMYGYPSVFQDEQEHERDMERLKEMYPDMAKKILQHVEEECDKMEYEGSMMFDEHPDRLMLMKITNDIYDKVKDEMEQPQQEAVTSMNRGDRRPAPPRNRWLGDLVEVLLFQEMHRRRCRHRNCRRWY